MCIWRTCAHFSMIQDRAHMQPMKSGMYSTSGVQADSMPHRLYLTDELQ